jgi:hypothetical protein
VFERVQTSKSDQNFKVQLHEVHCGGVVEDNLGRWIFKTVSGSLERLDSCHSYFP